MRPSKFGTRHGFTGYAQEIYPRGERIVLIGFVVLSLVLWALVLWG